MSEMPAWEQHEHATRTTCPACHFESSEGYPASHAPGCAEAARLAQRRLDSLAEDMGITEPDPQERWYAMRRFVGGAVACDTKHRDYGAPDV